MTLPYPHHGPLYAHPNLMVHDGALGCILVHWDVFWRIGIHIGTLGCLLAHRDVYWYTGMYDGTLGFMAVHCDACWCIGMHGGALECTMESTGSLADECIVLLYACTPTSVLLHNCTVYCSTPVPLYSCPPSSTNHGGPYTSALRDTHATVSTVCCTRSVDLGEKRHRTCPVHTKQPRPASILVSMYSIC